MYTGSYLVQNELYCLPWSEIRLLDDSGNKSWKCVKWFLRGNKHQENLLYIKSSSNPWHQATLLDRKTFCCNLEEYLNSVLPVVHRNLAMEISIYFPRQTLFCVKSAKSCCSASSFINSSSFCEIANCWQLCYKVDNNQLTRHANNNAPSRSTWLGFPSPSMKIWGLGTPWGPKSP